MSSNPAGTAWRIEADTFPNLNFSGYRKSLIYETNKIRQFLAETRAEHFVISAPKGFGKTLLLIAKRKQISEHRRTGMDVSNGEDDVWPAIAFSGGGEIVDRPRGAIPTFSKERLANLKSDYFFWKNLWWMSIMIAALKVEVRSSKRDIEKDILQCDKFLRDIILSKDKFVNPTTIFTTILNGDFKTQQKCIQGMRLINPLLDSIRAPSAFFIDNVDEYFKPFLEDQTLDKYLELEQGINEDSQYRSKSNDIWNIAQVSLVGAAYDIHKANSHIQVYCTIRREAFLRLDEYDTEYNQIVGCTIEIDYSKNELSEIFKKNIGLMSDDRLAGDRDLEPMERFFGPQAGSMRHRFVDRSEQPFDYLIRHTFYRPRDLMTIGKEIAALDAASRNPDSIKLVVDRTSADLVKGLIKELSPFFGIPNLKKLVSGVRKNVMTIDELDAVTKKYLSSIDSSLTDSEEHSHPFCVLCKIGMLGWIQTEFGRELQTLQRFVTPREISIRSHVGLPVTESFYLIHPALDHLVSENAGGVYFRNFHRVNVIGNGISWTPSDASSFVIKGDVCGFSGVMTTEFYEEVSRKMHLWAETSCRDVDYFEVIGGDSIVIVDKSADRAVRSAISFLNQAKTHRELPLTLRFGGATGPILYQDLVRRLEGSWEKVTIPTGLALRTSSRLEPHAPKGTLMVDEKFIDLLRDRSENFEIHEMTPDNIPSLAIDPETGKFLVQKNIDDPPYKTKLYGITLA